MSSSQQQNQQAAALKLMDQAKVLRDTDPSAAIGIFRSLKNLQNFLYRDYCGQQYATCLLKIGQTAEALEELTELIKLSQGSTPLRAHNFRLAVEASISLGQFDNVDAWLAEAEEVFEITRDFHNLGQVMCLRGVVEAHKGDFAGAQAHIEEGTRIADTYAPRTTSQVVDITRNNAPTSVGAGSL